MPTVLARIRHPGVQDHASLAYAMVFDQPIWVGALPGVQLLNFSITQLPNL
jgi:hypothetical protein